MSELQKSVIVPYNEYQTLIQKFNLLEEAVKNGHNVEIIRRSGYGNRYVLFSNKELLDEVSNKLTTANERIDSLSCQCIEANNLNYNLTTDKHNLEDEIKRLKNHWIHRIINYFNLRK